MGNQRYMWGAWVLFRKDYGGGGMWATWTDQECVRLYVTRDAADVAFSRLRRDVMPLVRAMRAFGDVASCTPVKVPMPAGPGQ